MNRISRIAIAGAVLLTSSATLAADRTVTLTVDKMTCASCPYIVKQALSRLSGVKRADVSFEEKTATVTFDDAVANVASLTKATGDVGFPSRLVEK
jgi:periplasmic mercuric ion binding protein